jgi:hypothetical protein
MNREQAEAKLNVRPAPVIDQPWFAVGAPWGDGTWINAGTEDPHGGTFVCDCETMARDVSQEQAAELAAHIVKVHNTDLARRVVERQMGVR